MSPLVSKCFVESASELMLDCNHLETSLQGKTGVTAMELETVLEGFFKLLSRVIAKNGMSTF